MRQDVVTWKGQLFYEDKPEPDPPALPGSLVAFSRNGELQGVAYRRAAPPTPPFQPKRCMLMHCTACDCTQPCSS